MEQSHQDREVNTKYKGFRAEEIAAIHLERMGYEIVARNFYCKAGELDIVALHAEELVFIEVRSRQSEDSLNPIFAISEKKIKSLKKAAQVYVQKNSITRPFRFDFAIVTMEPEHVVEIVQNAVFDFPFR